MIGVVALSLLLVTCSSVPYQAHSFNDLDLVQKMIVDKQVQYFKLDVSYATRESCEERSSWNSSYPCFRPEESVQDICCLALRGDTSSRPYFKYPFNTTSELVDLIKKVMRNNPNLGIAKPLLFAINFQYSHSIEDFLSDEFMIALAELEIQFRDRLLLGTGSDDFLLEYDRLCHYGSSFCTAERKKVAQSNMFLQSSSYYPHDDRDYKKRYRNFKTLYTRLEKFCLEGFPQWIYDYPQYPLIVWQPSNERQIQWTLSKILASECMEKHGRSIGGIAIASNLDLEMFTVYSKPTISHNFEESWDLNQNKLLIPGQRIRIISPSPNTILSVNQIDQNITTTIYNYDNNGKLREQSENDISILMKDEQIRFLTFSEEFYVIVTENDQQSKMYYFDYSHNLVKEQSAEGRVQAVTFREEEIIFVKNSGVTHTIYGTTDWTEIKSYVSLETYGDFSSIVLVGDNFLLAGEIDDSVFLVKVDSKSHISLNALTSGSNPQLLVSGDKVNVIFEDSMCSGGLFLNSNDMPACNPTIYTEFESMGEVAGLVSMIESSVDALMKEKEISPCSQKLNYAKLFVGADIGGAYVGEDLFLTGSYIPVEKQDLVLSLFCGAANFDHSPLYQKSSILLSYNKKWTTSTLQLCIQ